jgi:curved DNA-binding protein CbpA
MENLYDLLGVHPDDDAESLRKAYLEAAKASHPDHHGDDPEAAARFRQIAEAYEILRDAGQRAAYDRLLASQRRPLRATWKRSFFEVKRNAVTDVLVGVVLAVVLAGGYELSARMAETPADKAAVAHEPAQVAVVQPAERSDAVERDRLASSSAPQMPIPLPAAPPVATPIEPDAVASVRQTIAAAERDRDFDVPSDRASVGVATNGKGGEPPDRHDRQSGDGGFSAAESRNVAPLPASGVTASENGHDGKTPEGETPELAVVVATADVKPPEMRATALRLHAAMRQPPAGRPSFSHRASLANRHAFRRDPQYCEGDRSPLSRVRY